LTRNPVRFNPFSAAFRRDPYPSYQALREAKPVHKTLGMWVVPRHADVMSALRDRTLSVGLIPRLAEQQADKLAKGSDITRIRQLGRKSLVFTDNPDHARLRGLVNRVFTAQAVAKLRPLVSDVAKKLAQNAWEDGGMDLIADFATQLPITVLCDWMALPDSLRTHVGQWTHDIRFLLEPGLMKADDFTRVVDVVDSFALAVAEVIGHRRTHSGDDLVSQLLAVETAGGDKLSDEEIGFVCVMCFVAGNETTKSLIGNGVLALLQHEDQGVLLHSRPDLVQGAVDEALRYDCPLQLTKRLTTCDVRIGDTVIPEGEQILLCMGAANRDPKVFDRPDEFDITRDVRRHLAFGYGMHGCLGGMLAELQAKVAFELLFGCTERLELAAEDLEWQDHSFIIRGLKKLPVALRGTW
jgi:cytochrome P450